jgi:isocitrate/isopropylmalate dehydrogenase
MKIAVLPGDGIGTEIVAQAMKVLDVLKRDGMKIETEQAAIGGAGYDTAGDPLPEATLKLAKASDAVLLGAVAPSTTGWTGPCARSGVCCASARNSTCSPTCVRPCCIRNWPAPPP